MVYKIPPGGGKLYLSSGLDVFMDVNIYNGSTPSAYVMQPNSGLLRLDATTHIACEDSNR